MAAEENKAILQRFNELAGEVFRTGLHEWLDGTQGRLIEIGSAMHRQYCEWLDPVGQAQGA